MKHAVFYSLLWARWCSGVCTQPIRDGVTLKRRISLAGCKPRIIPEQNEQIKSYQDFSNGTFKTTAISPRGQWVNTLRPRQNTYHFQKIFWNAFSWMKMHKFRLRFHWSLFPRVQLTIFRHWFRLWLSADQLTNHYLNQWWLVYWCVYASLSLNELSPE